MIDHVVTHGLQYLSYGLEVSLVVVLFRSSMWKKLPGFFLYVLAYVCADVILRPIVLYSYGFSSLRYRYCYWTSDIALTVGAFALICVFFRRVFKDQREVWSMVRTMVSAIFILMAFISYFSLIHHYNNLFGQFLVGFQQNLYFACLVLNTVLYLMLQRKESPDDQLGLLVCGLGIEFAGPAASMALMHLMGGREAVMLASLAAQLCNLGMCMIWLYAVTRQPASARSREDNKQVPAFTEISMHGFREV